jgi:putrescine transport system ATP-binding protein
MASNVQSPAVAAGGPLVRFESVTKRFGAEAAIDGLSLDIGRGEFFALLGPSGCGKTTLLRLLAGFEIPDAGRVLLDGEDIAGIPAYRRPVNMMFQSYALFPHMTVEANVAFGLKQEGLPRSEIAARVREMLTLLQIDMLARRRPHQLSGGQRQRVALARALVKRPKVFLLDEPLAALDKKLRSQTRFELIELRRKLGLTFVIVTHDQEEAMSMADRIGVMNKGLLVQVGTPAEIYERPNSRWVAEFIGEVNLFEGDVQSDEAGQMTLSTPAGPIRCASVGGTARGTKVVVAIRPEKIAIARPDAFPHPNRLLGSIADIVYLGDFSLHKVRLDGGMTITVQAPNVGGRPHDAGEQVALVFPPDACIVLKD